MLVTHVYAVRLHQAWNPEVDDELVMDIDIGGLDEGAAYDLAAVWGDIDDCVTSSVRYGQDNAPLTVHVRLRRDWVWED